MATTKTTRTNKNKATTTSKRQVAGKASPALAAKKRSTHKKTVAHKVDYYPNRMTFWVSAAAGSLIALLAVVIAYNR